MSRYEPEPGIALEDATPEQIIAMYRVADIYAEARERLLETGNTESVIWLLNWPEMRALVAALDGSDNPWLRVLREQIEASIASREMAGGMPE